MDVKKYLARINFTGEAKVDLQTLAKLQRCHLMTVPFENLDIFLGKEKKLDLESNYHEVVNCRRGGWCYQLNSLFCWMLRELGFTVDMVCCRAWKPQGGWSRKFAHMGLVVHLEGEKYLSDVGWGGQPTNPSQPLLIKEGVVTDFANASFRMTKEDGDLWCPLVMEGDQSWQKYFSFYLEPLSLEDFRDASNRMQSPGSVLFNFLSIDIKADDTTWHFIRFRKYEKIRLVRGENEVVEESEDDLSVERLGILLREKFGMEVDLSDMDEDRWLKSSTRYVFPYQSVPDL